MSSVNQNKNYKLRVRYKKIEQAAWLSQLEIVSAIEHIVRRSGLPYAVSQGFSPHMKISFCSALSVGIESEKQIFDLYLNDYVDPDKCLEVLKSSSTQNLMPVSCKYVEKSDKLIRDSIYKYQVEIDRIIENIKVPKKIFTTKKHKEKQFIVADYLVDSIDIFNDNESSIITFKLKFFTNGSINADLFFKKLCEYNGISDYKIKSFKKI